MLPDLEKRQKEIAALAGGAAYAKMPDILAPITKLPLDILESRRTGVPIAAELGTPLEQLAEFTRQEANTLKAFAAEQGVKVPIVAAGPEDLGRSYFAQERGGVHSLYDKLRGRTVKSPVSYIGLGQSSMPSAMHEIGHASPILGSHSARRGFQSILGPLGHTTPAMKGLRAALLANVLMPPKEKIRGTEGALGKARHAAYEHAPAVVAATVAPQLLEEARASMHALRGAQRHGIGTEKALRELVPAFASHAAKAVTPVLAILVAKKLSQFLGGTEKTSAAAPAPPKPEKQLKKPPSTAWPSMGSAPKPKTDRPSTSPSHHAKGRAPAKPRLPTKFYSDMMKQLRGGGARIATKG